MHKSLTSKLALNKRSTLTKYAIDGWTEPKTWYGKAFWGTVGAIGGALMTIPTAGYAGWEYLKNEANDFKEQATITFYWKGGELWCRLPNKEVLGFQAQELSFLQDTKVAGIEGDFGNDYLVIRFEKTRGYQTASDRVIEMDKPYTNLKETLLWISDTQKQHQEYLDESVLQFLQANDYGESRVRDSTPTPAQDSTQDSTPDSAEIPGITRSRPVLQLQDSFSATVGMPGRTLDITPGMPGRTLDITPPESPISSISSECKMAEEPSLSLYSVAEMMEKMAEESRQVTSLD